MVWGHDLQLSCHSPLFHNFWQFTVKVAAAHHPIIQKKVEELLSKGVTEPYSGCAGFILACLWFLSVLVVSGPYITLSSLIIIDIYLLLRCLYVYSTIFGSHIFFTTYYF